MCVCLCACVAVLEGSESLHIYTRFFCVCVCFCLCVMSMSKHLMLIVRLLPNQLSCMVNKSVLIGSALQRLRYQNLIKSLFQPCLVARTKLCSVAMDTRLRLPTTKHGNTARGGDSLVIILDAMCTPRNALIGCPDIKSRTLQIPSSDARDVATFPLSPSFE